MPARLYDFDIVRVMITFLRRKSDSPFSSAKSTYASSRTSGPFTSSANVSSSVRLSTVPDGELGLAISVRFASRIGQGDGKRQSLENGTLWKRAPWISARVR